MRIAQQMKLTIGIGLVLLASAGLVRAAESPVKRPNFVVFLVDDLGWRDVGCFGSTFYETPHIDRLAASGMRFTSAYATCPVCSPSRVSMLTGEYPQRTEVTDYINDGGANQPENWKRNTPLLPAAYRDHLPLDRVTLAEALRSAGYATCFAGKWHMGRAEHFPEHQGFDFNHGGTSQGGPYGGKKYFSPYGNPRLPDGPEGEYLPLRLAQETASFIEQHRDRPFLAYLSFYSVHTPHMTTDELKAKYAAKAKALPETGPEFGTLGKSRLRIVQNHAVYGGMVEAMDSAVGIVLDKLRELKLEENTVVLFTSDNGGLSTSEGHPTSNLPLRGGKGWLYEGGVRVASIIRAPGRTKPGSQCDVPIAHVDYFPTMLSLAGVDLPAATRRDGVSIVPLLEGGSKLDRPALYWHYPHYGNQGGAPGGAVRSGDWKLIEWYEGPRRELYRLSSDLGEEHDLAAEEPAKVAELAAMLDAWRKEVQGKMPTGNPRFKESP